jgi:hypothetical protein
MEIVKRVVILTNLLRMIFNYILFKLIYNYYNNLFNIEIKLY